MVTHLHLVRVVLQACPKPTRCALLDLRLKFTSNNDYNFIHLNEGSYDGIGNELQHKKQTDTPTKFR
jgi:hypothetical protein